KWPHTNGSGTHPWCRVVQVWMQAVAMIRMITVMKSSAEADLVEVFSRRSLGAALADAQTIVVADRICAMTWKSNLRRQLSAQRRQLRLRSLIAATNATVAALKRGHAGSPAQRAAAAVKSSASVVFYKSRRIVITELLQATLSK